jgi:hypothetical protein
MIATIRGILMTIMTVPGGIRLPAEVSEHSPGEDLPHPPHPPASHARMHGTGRIADTYHPIYGG